VVGVVGGVGCVLLMLMHDHTVVMLLLLPLLLLDATLPRPPTPLLQAQQNQDNVMWEENRLLQSGVVRRTRVNEEEEKDLVRVQIIVMDIKPPFLDGRMVLPSPPSPAAPRAAAFQSHTQRGLQQPNVGCNLWRVRCTRSGRTKPPWSRIPPATCRRYQ